MTFEQLLEIHVLHIFAKDFRDVVMATVQTVQIGAQNFDPRRGFVVKYTFLRHPVKSPRRHHEPTTTPGVGATGRVREGY